MPDDPNLSNEVFLAVPGVLCVSGSPAGQRIVRVGPAAGWMIPAGIMRWEHELSFVVRTEMTAELARALHATLPREQIAPARFPIAGRAVDASPLLALAANLVESARKHGARVHTVGVDRVSSGFYYFAEGGSREPVNVQGSLIDMVAPSLSASSTNAEINEVLESLIDRLLTTLSGGEVSELAVELADALPRLSRDGTGLEGTDLEAFEGQARMLADRGARHEAAARRLAEALAAAARDKQSSARVPLYGEARIQSTAPIDVSIGSRSLRLHARTTWIVTGVPRDEAADKSLTTPRPTPPPSAPKPTPAPKPATDAQPAAQPRPPTEVRPTPEPRPVVEARPAVQPRSAADAGSATQPRPTPGAPRGKDTLASLESSPIASVASASLPATEQTSTIASTPVASPSPGAEALPPSPPPLAVPALRSGGPKAAKTSSHVAIFLLLAFVVTLYLFWRSLFGPW